MLSLPAGDLKAAQDCLRLIGWFPAAQVRRDFPPHVRGLTGP